MTIEQMWVAYKENKSMEVRNDIVMHYLGMVQKVVYSIVKGTNLWHLTEDFNSIGVMGLIDAVDKYDIQKNVSFETYASIRIKGSIKDYMRKQDPLSRGMRDAQKTIEDAKNVFIGKHNREPSDEELAKETGLAKSKVIQTLSSVAYAETVSFEEEIGESLKLFDMVPANNRDMDENLIQEELIERLRKGIETLNEREQKIVALYYMEELKLKDIAYIMDISEGRVCQIMKKALAKLRSLMEN